MRCVCGAVIPITAQRYPITPQRVTTIDDHGNKASTWETEIVKCRAKHAPDTAWNYINQAHLRDEESIENQEIRK